VKLADGQLKINRTGQAETVGTRPDKQAAIVGNIVNAIKKGVSLKKIGGHKGIDQKSSTAPQYRIERVEPPPSDPSMDLDDAEALAELAQDIERNKSLRQQQAFKHQSTMVMKKPGKELDNLLAQLDGLEDM
jgi:hypothetical protein